MATDKYINPYDKYTTDFLEKIFTAIVPTVSMVSGVS